MKRAEIITSGKTSYESFISQIEAAKIGQEVVRGTPENDENIPFQP